MTPMSCSGTWNAVPEHERRLAPILAMLAIAIYPLLVGLFWILYRLGIEP